LEIFFKTWQYSIIFIQQYKNGTPSQIDEFGSSPFKME
jgi:hypothetical protein